MKTQIAAFVTVALLASSSFAQYSSVTEVRLQDRYASQGVRVALVKPVLNFEVKASFLGETAKGTEGLDNAMGLSVGYASLPVRELGFTVNATYLDIKEQSDSASMFRVDGNLGYAFTSLFNLKGGLNVSDFNIDNSKTDFSPSIGLQASAGFQFTKNFGLDVGYVVMNQTYSDGLIRMDIKQSGPEIALNGTF